MSTPIHEINLLRDEFRPARVFCSSTQIVVGWVLSIVVCTFGSTALHAWNEQTETNVNNADEHIALLSRQISSLELALSNRRHDPALLAENDRLKAQLNDGKQLAGFLRTRKLDTPDEVPVSDVLSGFARQSAKGVWLNEIHVDNGELTIQGQVDDAMRIPGYLKNLGNERVFQGRGFTDVSVQPGNDTSRLLTFRLSSTPSGTDRGSSP